MNSDKKEQTPAVDNNFSSNQGNHEVLHLKELLHEAIGHLEPFQHCVLLDFPDYANIGDNLIWLGEVFYLKHFLQVDISYVASIGSFSEEELDKQVDNSPIFLSGGGNFGDLWPDFQNFRNQIISRYTNRPVIIFPQTIFFADPAKLAETAEILNAHPNLTLFARDQYSYEIAQQHFHNCRVFKSPDMALEMIGMFGSFDYKKNNRILYHCRDDNELNAAFSPEHFSFPNLVVADWQSGKYASEYYKKFPNTWLMQRLARGLQGLQEGNLIPKEWISRQKWKYFHPYAHTFDQLDAPNLHRKAWSYMHHGIYQFQQYRLIITNRLHGHILCILMGIPHVFLPNSYYKNENFYKAWTYKIPFCRFVNDPAQVESAVQELLQLY